MTGNPTSPQPLYVDASPGAAAMIESLRAFGYDLPTALADLVDNSLAAGARNIWLYFHWAGSDSIISLRDDGHGMTGDELLEAMRPGSKSPTQQREKSDLGRFGLGLKTASFSQCRLLSVRSRCGKEESTLCWDLDYVTANDRWMVRTQAPDGAEEFLNLPADAGSGTVVLWQNIDRLVAGESTDDEAAHKRFLDTLEAAKDHLGMIFHDYIAPTTPGHKAVKIHVNGHEIESWDPFLVKHSFTQPMPEETIYFKGQRIKVSPFVLPHHTHLDEATFARAAGPRGWNAHQGFYIYRNRRLLVAGDWLELGFQREEHYKLTRIRVDLPNNLDEDWQLDVKKSRAMPPPALKSELKRIAIATRSGASKIYRHRGTKLTQSVSRERVFLWEQKVRRDKIFYELNRTHPVIKAVLDATTDKKAVKALLRLCEETIPLPLIVTMAPEKMAEPFEQSKTAAIAGVMRQAYDILRRDAKLDVQAAKARLMQMEPFYRFPELVETIDGQPDLSLDQNPQDEEQDNQTP